MALRRGPRMLARDGFVPREAAATLRTFAQGFPVVAVTGPRQSGKTTLARVIFPDKPYVTLESPDQREQAQGDPRAFLGRYPDGAVIDEAQRCPELFSYLQERVDEDGRSGLFVLTGSQQFGLMAGVTQSLAGRVGLLTLLPFSLGELADARRAPPSVDALLHRGFYPPVHVRAVSPSSWYAAYVATYLERDVRQLVNVQDLRSFQRFLALCAGRCGQLLNLAALGAECGVAAGTVRAWLSVLEASYVVFRLQPYHRNFGKRVVKTPKLYFYDPGLAAWLLGVTEAAHLAAHPLRGALFEAWAVAELVKGRLNRGLPPSLYFWRDKTGHEIDVVFERGGEAVPFEVKSGATVARDWFDGLQRWGAWAGGSAVPGYLVHGGETSQRGAGTELVPWRDLPRVARGL